MNYRYGWLLWILLATACGGRSRAEGGTTSGAGHSGGGAGSVGDAGAVDAGAGNASAGSAGNCPDNLPGTVPTEGAACPAPGLICSGYGTLSCPLTAVCSSGSTWQINCPSSMDFGPCSCPHQEPRRVPKEHRATASACSHTRAASSTDPSTCPSFGCSQDSECMAFENGRCLQTTLPMLGCTCSYDECFTDAGCFGTVACLCREGSESVAPNYCASGSTCRVDADCGPEGYCSPSQAHEWCHGFYACHTPNDECLDDSDCTGGTHCDFDPTVNHWLCANRCGPSPQGAR